MQSTSRLMQCRARVVLFVAVEAKVVVFDAVEARVVVFVEVMEVQQVHRIVVETARCAMVLVSNTFWAATTRQEVVCGWR